MKDNIVLIGMPGVGKSTVGVVLAKALGYNFVDADLVIQQQTGKLLCELIAEHGTEGFLEIEDEVNSSIEGHKAVIATGGSAVYCANAMEHYKEIATVLYLSVSCDLKNRGVVLNDGQTLKDLYDERTAYYEKYADVTVNEEGLSIRETIDAVKEKLGME